MVCDILYEGRKEGHIQVLILVVMEYGLWHDPEFDASDWHDMS